MQKGFFVLLFFTFSLLFSQKVNSEENSLKKAVNNLDSAMKNNDPNIVNILCEDVNFGHSNGWIQYLNDFKKDIDSKKVKYQELKTESLNEIKIFKKTASVHRTIHSVGTYKTFNFDMRLLVLEVWRKINRTWKLWSRQSVEIKP